MNAIQKVKIVETAIITSQIALYDVGDVNFLQDVLNNSDQVLLLLDGLDLSTSCFTRPVSVSAQIDALEMLFPKEIASGKLRDISFRHNPYDANSTADIMDKLRFHVQSRGNTFDNAAAMPAPVAYCPPSTPCLIQPSACQAASQACSTISPMTVPTA